MSRRKKHKPSKQLTFKSRDYTKKVREVSQYAEFTAIEVHCYHCNNKSEIHKKPMRCRIHIGADYA